MSYTLVLSEEAVRHLRKWSKSNQKKTLKKIAVLFEELEQHPTTGTGRIEQLKGDLAELWSRRIDKGNRPIYRIEDEIVTVFVVSAKGHYDSK